MIMYLSVACPECKSKVKIDLMVRIEKRTAAMLPDPGGVYKMFFYCDKCGSVCATVGRAVEECETVLFEELA